MSYFTTTMSFDFPLLNFSGNNYSEQLNNETTPSNLDLEKELAAVEPIFRAAYLIIKISFPILVVAGTIGNVTVIAVLKRGAISTDNLRFFLSFLAVVDTVFLYTSALKTWVRVMWDFELLHLGSWSCKVGLFLNQLSVTLSAWMLVIITWQRWYTCSQPFRRCCPEKLRWRYFGLGVLIFVLVAINSYVLVTVERVEEPYSNHMCLPAMEFEDAISEIYPYLLMTLYSGVPALLLFILNGLLVRVLYQSRRALLSNSSASRESGQNGKVRARYNYVTAVLLTLSAMWFVLTFPHTIVKLVERMPDNPKEDAVQMLINVLLYVLMYINHSANFFIYYALLRGFRRNVKSMAKSILKCMGSVRPFCIKKRQPQSSLMNDSRGNNRFGNRSHTDSFVPLLVHVNGMWHRARDVKVNQ